MIKTITNNFFNSYKSAFNDFDARAITLHYQFPCIISDLDGLTNYTKREDLEIKFESNCLKIKTMGYDDSSYCVNEIKLLGKNIVSIDLKWKINFKTKILGFYSFYLCVKDKQHLKIFNAIVY